MKPKYLLGGSLIVAAAAFLIVTSMTANAQYFLTVEQVHERGQSVLDQSVRVSGAVINESVQFEVRDNQPMLEFDIADPDKVGAQKPLRIVYNGPKPDLINEPHAQAIVEGHLGADGKFYADNLLLKCPTRYEEQFPNQAEPQPAQG
ncbi:MAG: cytochrome c maturation protein CcmE [Chloroflexi bacterium]|nr:cytochrome c maturation protein CcmE [Chloroflexota bacterium]